MLFSICAATAPGITIGQAGLYALLGYAVVFLGLALLMFVMILLSKFFIQKASKAAAAKPEPEVQPAEPVLAPGSAGPLKLHNVDPKTAAMLMAIVADKLQKPLCQLRFLSIKEVDG